MVIGRCDEFSGAVNIKTAQKWLVSFRTEITVASMGLVSVLHLKGISTKSDFFNGSIQVDGPIVEKVIGGSRAANIDETG